MCTRRKYLALAFLAVLLSASPALAQSTSFFVKKFNDFNRAVLAAKDFKPLYPMLTKASVSGLKTLEPKKKEQLFRMLKMGTAMSLGTKMSVVDSKIGSRKADIKMKSKPKKRKSNGGTTTMSSSAEMTFLKEGGVWKLDFHKYLKAGR